jgi:putative phage-type endonuclease
VTAAVRQGSPEWHAARKAAVSSTDLPALLGVSPWKSEWDVAAEKLGWIEPVEQTLPMKIGLALEPLIRAEYEHQTGERLRRVHTLARHPTIDWAVASPDYTVVGRPWLVEAKWSLARRWTDGLPQDVEAQVQWAMGVTGRRRADVAALLGGSRLEVFEVGYDDALFEGLLDIAADFRGRLAAGGPFAETLDSLKRRYPGDDGGELYATPETDAAVRTLIDVRGRRKALEADEERLEVIIKAAMAAASTLVGQGWKVTWRRTKDVTTTDWKSVADGLLRQLPETDRDAIVGIHTMVRAGFRPFRVVEGGMDGQG